MPRRLASDNIKKIIGALRKQPMTFNELMDLGIPRKSVDRILQDYLTAWGLVYKDTNGRWAWYENTRFFSSIKGYDLALTHSTTLALSLGSLLLEDLDPKTRLPTYIIQKEGLKPALTVREALQFKSFIEEHLRTGYPDVYSELLEYRRHKSQLVKLREDHVAELLKRYEDKKVRLWFFKWKKVREGSWFRKIYPNTVLELDEGPVDAVGPLKDGEEQRFDELMNNIPKGYFEAEQHMEAAFKDVSGSIQLLLWRIQNGTPLEGRCNLCPKIMFRQPS